MQMIPQCHGITIDISKKPSCFTVHNKPVSHCCSLMALCIFLFLSFDLWKYSQTRIRQNFSEKESRIIYVHTWSLCYWTILSHVDNWLDIAQWSLLTNLIWNMYEYWIYIASNRFKRTINSSYFLCLLPNHLKNNFQTSTY